MKPKELETRLSNAYDAGFFDGYHNGVEDNHAIWVGELGKIKGVGPKLERTIRIHMTKAMERRLEDQDMQKNEISTLLKEEDGSSG